MSKSIEEIFIDYIAPSLPLFSRQQVAFRFQCPYCQVNGKNSKGNLNNPSDAKGFLYPYSNAWNYNCHKCGIHQTFEKFLEDQFPLLHFRYVSIREQLGTTGFQTNCPSLETILKKQKLLNSQPPQFRPDKFYQHLQRPEAPHTQCESSIAPTTPKVTKLPPMRSPQQQAGHQSKLNYNLKAQQQKKKLRDEWWYNN